ncbi:ribose ABC transporter permease [Escherichia coli]|uniref:Ribose ABC transporter permease n=1 Tax=Escherichia coli TaxID=562 RepID=A0A2X3K7N9_ECOLX|nr:ribose ABC transporter permease [Escherichia coli]
MTTQTVSGRRYFTKAWLMEQKSLIALLVLIAIVSTLSPNFFTINNLFNISPANLGERHYGGRG